MKFDNNARTAQIVRVLVFGCLGGLTVTLQAATISGTFDGVSTITPTGTPGMFTQSFSGDGTDDTYGAFTPSSMSNVDFSHPPAIVFSDGTFLMLFPDGSSLFGTSSGDGTGNGSGMATFSVDFVITGGTGMFAHDIGTATVTGTITSTGATTEAIDASYTGSLTTVPEPSALILTAAGLAGVVVRRKASALSRTARA